MTDPARRKPAKVALVTGASSGIGHATALALRDAGFVVVASARRPESIADLEAAGIATVRIDVADEASMREGVAEAERRAGRIGLLVNNAGYAQNGPLEEIPPAALRAQFETNVFGLVRMAQLVLPGMRERGAGRIVNVGSMGGSLTLPGGGAYHASKYAVEAISDALRVEVGQFGIDVVLIRPTGVSTPFMAKMEQSVPAAAATGPYAPFMAGYERIVGGLTREGNPGLLTAEEVARVIVRAATAADPAPRYTVGWSARLAVASRRLLPDRAWDGVLRRVLGVPGPRQAATAGAPTEPATAPAPTG